MKYSLFLCLISTAWASDDANLMQHGLSLAEQTVTVKAGLKQIQEEIDQIPNQGKARQMAIDALMKSVSETDKIDDAAKEVLRQIDEMLDSILDDLSDEMGIDQTAMNAVVGAVNNCNDDAVAGSTQDDTDTKNAFDTALGNHADCRTLERTEFSEMNSECLALEEKMGAFNAGTYCKYPASIDFATAVEAEAALDDIVTKIQAWVTMIEDGKAWIEPFVDDFEAAKTACDSAITDHTTQRNLCNTKQRTAEDKFCLWRSARLSMCNTHDTCYSNAIASHNTISPALHMAGDRRVDVARLIKHVKCLLNNLREFGGTDTTACGLNATQEQALQDDYNIEDPTIPAKATCPTAAVENYPNGQTEDSWAAEYLADYKGPNGQYFAESPLDSNYDTCP